MSDIVKYDNNGKIYVPCRFCGAKARPDAMLCNRHLREYFSGKLVIECAEVKKIYEENKK